jgi:hypothetical protein
MSGIYKQIQKQFGENVGGYMIASRCAQGAMEYECASPGEREDVIRQWHIVQASLRERRTRDPHHTKEIVRDLKSKGVFKLSSSERSTLTATADGRHETRGSDRSFKSRSQSPTTRSQSPFIPAEYEEAIKKSVQQTSTGDPDEDEMIERALRASVLELKAAESAGEDEERAYDRAIKASIREAERVRNERENSQIAPQANGNTAQASLKPPGYRPELPPRSAVARASEDDEGDAEFQRAIAESMKTHEEALKRAQAEKSEMDVVMEYMKRQSLAEYEYQQQMKARAETG